MISRLKKNICRVLCKRCESNSKIEAGQPEEQRDMMGGGACCGPSALSENYRQAEQADVGSNFGRSGGVGRRERGSCWLHWGNCGHESECGRVLPGIPERTSRSKPS